MEINRLYKKVIFYCLNCSSSVSVVQFNNYFKLDKVDASGIQNKYQSLLMSFNALNHKLQPFKIFLKLFYHRGLN